MVDEDFRNVELLRRRRRYGRLDTTPFLLIYVLVLYEFCTTSEDAFYESSHRIAIQLGLVATLHVLLALFCHWSVSVKKLVAFLPSGEIQGADAVLVQYKDYSSSKEILPILRRRPLRNDSRMEVSFEARFRRYVYNFETRNFRRLEYPVKESMDWYLHHEGFKTPTEVSEAIGRWGANAFDVPVPKFTSLLQQQLLAPFFVFQTFCVGLWCLDEYWMYSVFTLFLLVFFECTVAGQRLRNLQHLRSLQTPGRLNNVFRSGKWEKIPAELLLPGDVISITRPMTDQTETVIPADLILLNGTCIVDESVLTGESTPQWKAPLSNGLEDGLNGETCLDLKRDKLHVVYGGTKCLQHSSQKGSFHIKSNDGGCVGLVIRTGFESAQGNLMGTILHSTEQVSANNWETGIFILFLLSFAIAASGYVLFHGLQDPSRSRFKLFLNCTMIITSVIPPELPMELSIAVNHSLIQLMRKRIFCTEPFRIPFAGAVDVCCFDKTGTLTDDWMTLEGVACRTSGLELINPGHLPLEVSRILASCHSLTVVNRQLVGDPLEKAAFDAIGWSLRSEEAEHPQKEDSVLILHRYHFSAQLKRMAVVMRSRSSSNQTFSVVKGAPETMFGRFKDPPVDYHQQYRKFASLGGRIIALGVKTLQESNPQEHSAMRGFNREAAETDLSFLGFAVFQCPLKADSAEALLKLKSSSHQLVMITGDAALTACNVAKMVHIVTRPILILTNKSQMHSTSQSQLDLTIDDFEWMSPDQSERFDFEANKSGSQNLAAAWDLCITGDCFGFLERTQMLPFLIPLIQVFARVAPEHKATVVETLRKSGRVVLMCGDGTNDVGALKAAHVGVALLTGIKERAPNTKTTRSTQKTRSATRNQPSLKRLNQGNRRNPAMEYVEELEKQGRPINPSIKRIAQLVEEMSEDPGFIKPGDSSMAAPFTSKKPSVMPCTDLVMQGRSTLVSTVQMFKILGLMSLANAYALSVMHLQGVKIGDVQVTITGLLSAGMFFFLSNAEPLKNLSKQRPHPSIFCPYVFLSVLGQSIIHMSYLIYLYQCSLTVMPTDKEPEDTESGFKPNLVNSVCFLVNFIIQIITFAVNYSGAPFTTSLMQNQGLIRCLMVSSGFALLLTVDILPGFNSLFEMVFIPHSLRVKILCLAILDFLATYGLESFLKFAFPAPLPQLESTGGKQVKESLKKKEN